MISLWNKFFRFFASVKTGVFLLLTVILFSAVGTVILQRPTTELSEIERAYSPSTLALLDRLLLTDIYHAWYFVTLLGLVILSISFVSIDRWPNAWRYYARPYKFAESHFRASVPTRTLIPVANADGALEAAERAFQKQGLPVSREVSGEEIGLFSERARIAEFAVYVVHASLLFLMLGYLLDLQVGYRGTMSLTEGETTNKYTVLKGAVEIPHALPFSIRCDGAKQVNYTVGEMMKFEDKKTLQEDTGMPTGMGNDKSMLSRETSMPKQYWSQLAVVENGHDVLTKKIIVNDPLTYRGIRFFQSGMGQSSKLASVTLALKTPDGVPQSAELAPGKQATAGDVTVVFTRFVPEYYLQDGEVHTKSETARNPALQFTVIKGGAQYPVWIMLDQARSVIEKNTGVELTVINGKLAMETVLQVSYQPGQWLIFPGVLLMVAGLMMVLLLSHTRVWAMVVNDPKVGTALWVGGTANRNKIRFQQQFNELVESIKNELNGGSTADRKDEDSTVAKA